jgi:paraquat-inducible protein B
MKTNGATATGLFLVGGVLAFILAMLLLSSGNFWKTGHIFVLQFEESVNGLDPGAPVKLRGVKIGQVLDVKVQFDAQKHCVVAPVTIQLEDGYFRRNRGQKLKLESAPDRPLIVGMVGTLQMESLVTGKLFVELNYAPTEAKTYLQLDEDGIPEIPTKFSNLQSLSEQLLAIVDGLSRINYGGIGLAVEKVLTELSSVSWSHMAHSLGAMARSIGNVADGEELKNALENFSQTCRKMGTLADRFSSEIPDALKDARSACEAFAKAAGRVQFLLEDGSFLTMGARFLAIQLGEAARSLRNFFDFLEQNPSSLLYGKFMGEAQ